MTIYIKWDTTFESYIGEENEISHCRRDTHKHEPGL